MVLFVIKGIHSLIHSLIHSFIHSFIHFPFPEELFLLTSEEKCILVLN